MSGFDLSRSVRFVSLDTHPANDALVVTYEILVVVADQTTGQELTRRNKSDQFQITISALGGFGERAMQQTAAPNWPQLSEEILAKCPILSGAERTQTLESIQLNLLYLFNRRQQIGGQPSRPLSSASTRLRSGTPLGGGRLPSARLGSAAGRPQELPLAGRDTNAGDSPLKIWQFYFERELKQAQDPLDYARLDEFLLQLDEHLLDGELELRLDESKQTKTANLETQLEGLYGDSRERRESAAFIRRLARQDEQLASISSNRLLVCAMLRTLRDSDGLARDRQLAESILYCLIRLTSFEDTFNTLAFSGSAREISSSALSSAASDPVDLVRVVIDLLDNHVRWLTDECEANSRLLANNFYHTNSLFVVLANLLRLDSSSSGRDNKYKLKRKLIQHHGAKLADILVGSFVLLGKHLTRDIRTANKSYERVGVALMELLKITRQLSVLKDFVALIKVAPRLRPLVESLTSILSTLQLCRPGSGSIQQKQQLSISDKATLCETFELEMEILKLVNNMIYDARLRTKFMRKNLLLKCVLRNLVVFLAASRKSSTLKPYDRSYVLLAPFKCLYELSCLDTVKQELFKSRIVMKCLLEYLISSSSDLEAELRLVAGSSDCLVGSANSVQTTNKSLDLNQDDQIVLDGSNASQYIVSLWMNLSARPEAPFYNQGQAGAEDLRESIWDYMGLATSNVQAFAKLVEQNDKSTARLALRSHSIVRDLHLMNYTHMKLLRNLSQFLPLKKQSGELGGSLWIDRLTLVLNVVVEHAKANRSSSFVPLAVECLATLTNLIESNLDQYELGAQAGALPAGLFGEGQLLVGLSSAIEQDDLLLVAINFLGALAQSKEICTPLEPIHRSLICLFDCLLETKHSDTEMLVSCLFTLAQLMNHSSFLHEFGSSLDCNQQQQPGTASLALVDKLSNLVMHPDLAVVRLSILVLNVLKQFEELQSLCDSFAGQRRFIAYNRKWLNAIRANRGDEDPAGEVTLLEEREKTRANSSSKQANDNELMLELDYVQLRTINEDEVASHSSSRITTSNSSRDSRPQFKQSTGFRRSSHSTGADEELEEGLEEEDEEEEEEATSEPDLNVIDANSMIRHLTHRREYRDELARR